MQPGATAAVEREEERGQRLIYAIGRYDTALRAELKRRLDPLTLTIREFTTLSVLSGRSGLSNAQLARRALVTPQAMNQVLATLVEKGLVSRQPEPGRDGSSHHRARGTRLTPEGERQVARCEQIVEDVERASFPHMAPAERAALTSMLREATQRLRNVDGD